jgi:CRP-like cAMP-binding protein
MASSFKTEVSVFDALRASRLASELTDAQCRTLAERMSSRKLADGELLVREGGTNDQLHLIVSGALGVVRNAGTAEEVALFALTAGDLAGELSFLDDTVHYASLVVRGPTQVISLSREKLESLLDAEPLIVYRVMRAIVRAVHAIQRRLSAQSVELSNYIYKQHGRY